MKNISPVQSIFRTLLYELSFSYNKKYITGYTRIIESIKLFTQLPSVLCPSLQFFTNKDARTFWEIACPFWDGKKEMNNSKNVFYVEYIFTHILVFSISTELCYSRRNEQ